MSEKERRKEKWKKRGKEKYGETKKKKEREKRKKEERTGRIDRRVDLFIMCRDGTSLEAVVYERKNNVTCRRRRRRDSRG